MKSSGDAMPDLCQEIKDFIRACEALHGRAAEGHPLTEEELEVLEYCAIDLLATFRPQK
jgi:hypothetical protein